ncbi:MAG: hypothetical protein Q9M91_05770 [Candidatus Dojkabacteria bacterium]|nr:hypothetical protein [Candidatus Dojkabacteria bacterium]
MIFSFPKLEIIKKDNSVLNIEGSNDVKLDKDLKIVLREFTNIFEFSLPEKNINHVFCILDIQKGDDTYVISIEKNREKEIIDFRINGEKFEDDFYQWLSESLKIKFSKDIWQKRFIDSSKITDLKKNLEEIEAEVLSKDVKINEETEETIKTRYQL